MSDSKVFMFPENGTNNSGLVSMLAPLLQQRGVDPNVLLAMKNNSSFGGEGSSEVDNMLLSSKSIVDSVAYHNNVISSCENILKDLNPRFAKEKERDEDISNLKNKIGGIESKMDKILTLLSKEGTK